MDFSFDETQQAVTALAADVLRRESGGEPAPDWPGQDGPGWSESAWKAMAEAGLLGLAVPAADGGEGLGPLETALVLTEVGRQAAAVPALAALALGVLPVARYGTAEQRSRLLPGVAAGTHLLTAATRQPATSLGAPSITARPVGGAHGDPVRLTGTAVGVPFAAAAHRILVPARTSTAPAATAPAATAPAPTGQAPSVQPSAGAGAVYLVAPDADGVSLTRTPSASGTPEYTVRLDGAVGEPLGAGDGRETDAVAGLCRYAVAGACATAVGVLDGALALTAEHLRTREQFGKPLAAFQAVAQQIAEVYTAARTLRLATVSACWRLATGRDADGDLDVARYWLAAEALPALHVCQHLHGGLGVDITYPLHRFYSTAKDLARFVGGVSESQDRLGDRIAR